MHIFAIVINNKTILRMKKLFIFLVSIGMALSLASCVSTAYAQTDEVYVTTSEGNVDTHVIISYGVPVYNEAGLLMYYVYSNRYYYPYWATDRYYFHVYTSPLAIDYYYRWYRPVPRDFHRHFNYHRTPIRHRPPSHFNHHGGRPYNYNNGMRPHNNNRPSINHNRPRPNINRGGHMGGNRPMTQPRSSTRNSGGGHFGGSRMGGRR